MSTVWVFEYSGEGMPVYMKIFNKKPDYNTFINTFASYAETSLDYYGEGKEHLWEEQYNNTGSIDIGNWSSVGVTEYDITTI